MTSEGQQQRPQLLGSYPSFESAGTGGNYDFSFDALTSGSARPEQNVGKPPSSSSSDGELPPYVEQGALFSSFAADPTAPKQQQQQPQQLQQPQLVSQPTASSLVAPEKPLSNPQQAHFYPPVYNPPKSDPSSSAPSNSVGLQSWQLGGASAAPNVTIGYAQQTPASPLQMFSPTSLMREQQPQQPQQPQQQQQQQQLTAPLSNGGQLQNLQALQQQVLLLQQEKQQLQKQYHLAQFQQQQQQQPQPQQQQPQAALPERRADAFQGTLIDVQPSENEKLRQAFEALNLQLQSHMKRMEHFTQDLDQRLSSLEDAVKELSRSRRDRESYSSSNRDRERTPSHKALEKKKKRIIVPETKDSKSIPIPKTSSATQESDEELARRLQQQFNAEAEVLSVSSDRQTLTDEEYAQRLQAEYLKRDTRRAREDKKNEEDKKKEEEAKPSLWSRLFGGATETEQDNEGQELKAIDKKSSKTTTVGAYPSLPTSTGALQPMPVSPYYYPQQPMIMGQGGVPQYTQYIPLQTPGPYMLQPPTQQH